MTLHTKISYAKSVLRIAGFSLVAYGHLLGAAVMLIVAEVLGIAEELPGMYKGTDTGVIDTRTGRLYPPGPRNECDCSDCMEPTLR